MDTEKTLPSILKKGYYKTVHPAPSSSTQLISISTQLISTSNQLISTSNQLHPPPPSSFQRPASSLQHPQQYSNQNIALNWAISPSLGRKTQSCQFRLKIGTHGISRMLTLIPTLIFWNSDPKIKFWANLGPKSQSCPFCLNIGTQHSFYEFRTLNSFLGKFRPKKSKLFILS